MIKIPGSHYAVFFILLLLPPAHAQISSLALCSGTRWTSVFALNMRDQVLYPHIESGTIRILYILVCTFLDINRDHKIL
jgi:hypothetical protein